VPASRAAKRRLEDLQTILSGRRDDRMRLVQAALRAIRVVKACGWERDFLARIGDARAREMAALRAYLATTAAMLSVVLGAPSWIGLVTFVLHAVVLERDLTAAQAFTSLALFNLPRSGPETRGTPADLPTPESV